jgi:hypothetical protein
MQASRICANESIENGFFPRLRYILCIKPKSAMGEESQSTDREKLLELVFGGFGFYSERDNR